MFFLARPLPLQVSRIRRQAQRWIVCPSEAADHPRDRTNGGWLLRWEACSPPQESPAYECVWRHTCKASVLWVIKGTQHTRREPHSLWFALMSSGLVLSSIFSQGSLTEPCKHSSNKQEHHFSMIWDPFGRILSAHVWLVRQLLSCLIQPTDSVFFLFFFLVSLLQVLAFQCCCKQNQNVSFVWLRVVVKCQNHQKIIICLQKKKTWFSYFYSII